MGDMKSPTSLNENVEKIAHQLVGDEFEHHFLVPIPYGQVLDCFENVQRYIKEHGGQALHGWKIWEWPNVLIEGEFHSVWLGDDGVVQDLTPNQDLSDTTILFIVDLKTKYYGSKVQNYRLALSRERVVKDFIEASISFDKAFSKVFKHLEYGKEAAFDVTHPVLGPILQKKSIAQEMIKQGLSEKDECICRFSSRVSYKKCCGSIKLSKP